MELHAPHIVVRLCPMATNFSSYLVSHEMPKVLPKTQSRAILKKKRGGEEMKYEGAP
jgi:hypothetical protein